MAGKTRSVDIETVLTLVVAAGILATAGALRLVAIGIARAAGRGRASSVLGGARAATLFLAASVYSFLKESATAALELATFYGGRPEETPYLAGISLVPTYDPMENTTRWVA